MTPAFRAAILLTCALGIASRFIHLDQTVYWFDEAITSLWLSGHTYEEVSGDVLTGREFGVADLEKYQRVNPDRGLWQTLDASTQGDPHFPPFYILLLWTWVAAFGDSVTAIRSLSAVFGLLSLPAMYWLSAELFRSRLTSWIAVALLSVSPFHIAYAQEARAYSLWILFILISTAALLRALRQGTSGSWTVYAVAATLAMYAHALSGIVLMVHGLYVAGTRSLAKGQLISPVLTRYLVATGVVLTLFAPWAGVMVMRRGQIDRMVGWLSRDGGAGLPIRSWAGGLLRNYLDFGWSERDFGQSIGVTLLMLLMGAALVSLAGFAFAHAWRYRSKHVWLLLLLLTVAPWLCLALPDAVFGGGRSAVPRYLVASYLGLLLSFAGFIGASLDSHRSASRALAGSFLALLLGSGAASCIFGWTAVDRWTKGTQGRECLVVAETVNGARDVLLVIEPSPGTALALSRLLKPDARLQTFKPPDRLEITNRVSTIVLFRVPDAIRERLRQHLLLEFELVDRPARLWRSVQKGG